MHRALGSVAVGILLFASLAAKGVNLARSDDDGWENGTADVVAFLQARGLDVILPDDETEPAWITATRGDCRVRIADVSPQGWYQAIVAEQATGQQLRYAFAEKFHAEQPVVRTKIEDYRRRLLRYFGMSIPPPPVRAIVVAPACPEGLIRPEDADILSK